MENVKKPVRKTEKDRKREHRNIKDEDIKRPKKGRGNTDYRGSDEIQKRINCAKTFDSGDCKVFTAHTSDLRFPLKFKY